MLMTIYAIGDIHGQIGMLDAALARIEADGGDTGPGGADEVIFLGDLVDRGPAARQVLERLIAGRAEGRRWSVIRGNHDTMFLRFLRNGELNDPAIKSGNGWTHYTLGGCATLESYGVDTAMERPIEDLLRQAQALVPAEHRAFLEGLPLYLRRPGLLFVHAGIRPGVALEDQAEQDLIWIRDDFYAEEGPLPWLVVHGHTIVSSPTHFGNRIDIDTGAGANPTPRYLSVAAFEGTDCFIVTDEGRQPLLPPTPSRTS